MHTASYDIAVIGGGLAGLAAALYAARAGRKVALVEQSGRLGGRGQSTTLGGAILNFGPHALYRGGPAESALRDLGVPFRGSPPSTGTYAERAGRLYKLPAGLGSLLSTNLFGLRGKWSLLRALTAALRADSVPWVGRPLSDWLDAMCPDPAVRDLLAMLLRVSTYCEDPAQCAGAALEQLKLAVGKGVLYLDGGWQSLTDHLAESLRAAGAEVLLHAKAEQLLGDEQTEGLQLADGRALPARAVILTGTPKHALSLLSGKARQELAAQLAGSSLVRAACLDVVLSSLPRPEHKGIFGLARPLYLSLHSEAAKLAPPGVVVLHAAKYLSADEAGAPAEAELEGFLDLAQPGWRDRVLERRFLPEMTVTGWRCAAARGGLAGRPSGALASLPGLSLAGDWVGASGMLLDASLSSAKRAALRAVEGSAWKS